jgi:hypothetical protein
MTRIPTLPRMSTKPEFARAFRSWVVERIEAQRAQGLWGEGRDHFDVVDGFAAFLAAEHQDPLDQQLVALAAISQAMIEIGREDGSIEGSPGFCSTHGQRHILAVAGDVAHPAPSMAQLLEEIVAAGAVDLAAAIRVSRQRLREKAVAAEDATAAARSEAEGLRVDQEEVAGLRAEVEAQQTDIAERDSVIQEFQIHLGQRDVPRRVRVETGIYRLSGGGFDVNKPKSAGGPGFERAASLDEARRLRAEFTGQDPIGEAASTQTGGDGDVDDALDAREAELGRELTDEEIDAVGAEFQPSMATAARGEAE